MSRFFTSTGLALLMAVIVTLPARADDAGAAIYKAKCASCHAADGSGSTPAGKTLAVGDLRAPAVQKLSDADLMKIIADGKGKMPAYAKRLSADEIKSLVATIRTLASK